MKKQLPAILLSIAFILVSLTGCGTTTNTTTDDGTASPSAASPAADDNTAADTEDLGEPVTLTVSISASSTDALGEGMVVFKEKAEELSNKNITIDLYTDSALFSQEEEVAAVVAGDCDMTLTGATWLTTGSPWVSMFIAGYIFEDYDHMSRVMNGEIGEEAFNKISEEQGLLPLNCWYKGARQISLSMDKEVKTPEDLSGIKLRMPNSEAMLFLGEALGANPTPISFSELYLALQTGVVDGQDNPLETIYSGKLYEVQKSITITDHVIDFMMPTINNEKWQTLTDAQKDIIMQALEAGREYTESKYLASDVELIDFFEEEGLSVYYADKDAFKEHVRSEYLNSDISSSWDMELYERVINS